MLSLVCLVTKLRYGDKGKGMVLYSAVSSPLDRSKRFTLSSPGRPVHSDTVLGFSWKHSSHAAIAQRLFTRISTTVYSQVLIYTAESTEASWSERKCPNFETVTTGIRTRALSIASPAFYQLSHRASDKSIVNIMKVYIERNNLQLELIRYRKKCRLCSHLLLRSNGFNAISPTERISGGFKPLRLRFRQSRQTRDRGSMRG